MNINPAYIAFSAIPAYLGWCYFRYKRRLAFIETYKWPPALLSRVRLHYPDVKTSDDEKIARALKQFFRAYLNSGRRYVAMPSKAADSLWHEFILYTKAYDAFCSTAFGRFLHHSPAVVLNNGAKRTNEGLRRVWWHACKEENIDPRAPTSLPLLFRLDAELNIPDGYKYTPNCKGQSDSSSGSGATQCGSDFGSSSYDGGTDGFGDGDGGGSADSGGDGGGGCGGGGD